MSERQTGALDAVAHKWRRLAERRRAHFIELFYSGRWKHYYTEEQFLQRMREVIRAAERWALIAPPPAEEVPAVDEAAADVAAPAESVSRRDAA
jgi:uncharacterized repeat protein (TIGR03809 family)